MLIFICAHISNIVDYLVICKETDYQVSLSDHY